jgi:hypothetical protein
MTMETTSTFIEEMKNYINEIIEERKAQIPEIV